MRADARLAAPLGAFEGDECVEDLVGDVFRNKSVFQGLEVLLEIGGGGEELGKVGVFGLRGSVAYFFDASGYRLDDQ